MTTDAIGLYVHIPFCVRKCNYCDFCSFPISNVNSKDEYISRLCDEIASYKDKNLALDSIFFGGGTPSLLEPSEFEKICSCICETFNVMPECEFTIEANPKTIDAKKLAAFKNCGVNRISIGLQSIHENEMKSLGRIHNFVDFLESYNLARACGIENINIDLMYAIPGQTMDSFKTTLETVVGLSPEHISLYGLILEEGTPFYEWKDKLDLPGEDAECSMYDFATDFLRDRGYNHYEISNYAKSGFECKHNLKYWRCKEYIGVGLSAYSYFDGHRFGRGRDMNAYLLASDAEYEYNEKTDVTAMAYEYVMLGIRLREGISLSEYKEKFGCDFLFGREDAISNMIQGGYAAIDGDRLYLTERGFYISSYLLTELI